MLVNDIELALHMLKNGNVSGAKAVLEEVLEVLEVCSRDCEDCGMDEMDCICDDFDDDFLRAIDDVLSGDDCDCEGGAFMGFDDPDW